MIEAVSDEIPYRVRFGNGVVSTCADAPVEKGGGGTAFGPHELLEAALATCMVMTLHMTARREGLSLRSATARVRLDRSVAGEAVYHCDLEMLGDLTAQQKERLRAAAQECPVSSTLSRRPIVRMGGTTP